MKKKSLLPLLLILLLLLILIGALLLFALLGIGGSPAASSPSLTSQENGVSDAGPVFVPPQELEEYLIGETWSVEGQWDLTVTGVRESQGRNESTDKNPAAVYIVDYTYTNTGYIDDSGLMDGLFITMSDTIVDAEGDMGYDYPGHISDHPQQVPVGASCNAQACIGVDHPGDFSVTVSRYDGQGDTISGGDVRPGERLHWGDKLHHHRQPENPRLHGHHPAAEECPQLQHPISVQQLPARRVIIVKQQPEKRQQFQHQDISLSLVRRGEKNQERILF